MIRPRITFTDILATLAWAGFVVVMIMIGGMFS